MANQQLLLRNLHTFDMAAKTLSFTITGKQLHLTQGAVSHRIKVLEKELGFNLFVRGTRQLELTEEGARFHSTLSKNLHGIFSEIEEIKSTDMVGELNIATSTGFANGWLLPRLSDFKNKYPKFNLNIWGYQEQEDFHKHNIEVAIYYDTEDTKDVYRKRLFGDEYIPVCTPQYAKKHRVYEDGLESLKRINFIHAVGSDVWQRWRDYMQLDIDIFNQFYCVSHREMGYISALHNLGVGMGRYQFVKDLIESGELVTPYPSMSTTKGYDLLCPLGTEDRPKIRTFINWIEGQL
ncbi:LysR substrate-binding domain-containing protein [Vibrio tubiashii]|uniref:LysR substrate-binding domain-containing protein n=1 Tax=Vibrio tubiashii TaxID=29498 RepID=UPI00234F78DC|nr:LysR substrate-binding domain-containing protein [Vibrio tubiashii]WCP66135.1 LysR substrate-binding domain-containing protein [Vibrio tubiashii]